MMMIETLLLSVGVIIVSIWEFKTGRKIHAPYDHVTQNSSHLEEMIMKRFEE